MTVQPFVMFYLNKVGLTDVNITDETDSFNLTQNPKMTALLRLNYTTSHEGIYTVTSLNDLKTGYTDGYAGIV